MGRQDHFRDGVHRKISPPVTSPTHEPDEVYRPDHGPDVSSPQIQYYEWVVNETEMFRFMDSLQWVDQTYVEKHEADEPDKLRSMYFPNLRLYSTRVEGNRSKRPMDAAIAYLLRFGRRSGLSLALYLLSFLPVVGRLVLPAASFYAFNRAVGPIPATVIFGGGLFLPRRYLVVFLQAYFSSRSLMRELVSYLGFSCSRSQM